VAGRAGAGANVGVRWSWAGGPGLAPPQPRADHTAWEGSRPTGPAPGAPTNPPVRPSLISARAHAAPAGRSPGAPCDDVAGPRSVVSLTLAACWP